MNVLLIGSGGREHAIAWKLSQSPSLNTLYIAPGNPGTEGIGNNVVLDIDNTQAVVDFIKVSKIELIVVGPEVPLVQGFHDRIAESDLMVKPTIIGPKAEGAVLEGSKKFAKEFMHRHQIPTARYQTFDKTNLNKAASFLDTLEAPFVLKADGLAAGKGVLIIEDKEEALAALKNIIEDQPFGKAGDQVVIEEFLHGIELSVFVLTDGKNYKILPTAKDYKRIGEGDTGLNTGGMGAISPAPSVSDDFMSKVEERIIKPTIDGFQKDGIDYQGFVFIGLMDVQGDPMVIEYNVRLGDPETEVILPRIENDLLAMLASCKDRQLSEVEVKISPMACSTVMLVSGGYPTSYDKGFVMTGLETIPSNDKAILLFHAGTRKQGDQIVTQGGRVLAVTSMANNLETSIEQMYRVAKNIHFDKVYYRIDIGYEIRKK